MEFAESEFSIETGLSYENSRKCLCDECSVQAIEDEVDGVYFETCEECGKEFDLIEENGEFERNFTWGSGAYLRDYWDEKILCCQCALKKVTEDELKKRKRKNIMSIIGKIHEISLYGLITSIVCFCTGKITVKTLWESAFFVDSFLTFFQAYLFWSMVLFIPIAIVGAFATKYVDGGEGLTFASDNIVVIFFSHIAEELLGLILTPFWFLKDLFTKNFNVWKIMDYVTYLIELPLIFVGIFLL